MPRQRQEKNRFFLMTIHSRAARSLASAQRNHALSLKLFRIKQILVGSIKNQIRPVHLECCQFHRLSLRGIQKRLCGHDRLRCLQKRQLLQAVFKT